MADYNSFTEAVRAARAGQQDAFSWLYEKTSKEKYYIAIKYMKDPTEAADVLQDAYMKAWQSLDSLGEPEKFPGWIGQIVANTALSVLRKKRPVTFSDMIGENDEGDEFVYDIEDEAIDRQPELNYTTNERQDIIRSMIDSLTDEQRLCIMMYYIEELSVQEIAETLGCSENTVKSRLNYGRKNIRHEADELKKKGYNFYSLAPLPLLLLLLRTEKASAMGASSAVATATGTATAGVSAGASATAGGAVSTGFLATAVGKVIIGVAIAATMGLAGFSTFTLLKSMDDGEPATTTVASEGAVAVDEETTEAKDEQAGEAVSPQATEPVATTEPLPPEKSYRQIFAEYMRKNPHKKYKYDLVYIDADDVPELCVQKKKGGDWWEAYPTTICVIHDGKVRESQVHPDGRWNVYPSYTKKKNLIYMSGRSMWDHYYTDVYRIGEDGKLKNDEYMYIMSKDRIKKNGKNFSDRRYLKECGNDIKKGTDMKAKTSYQDMLEELEK